MSQSGRLVRHPLAIAGALVASISAVVFLALVAAELIGVFSNPYAGLVVFVAIPAILVLGLVFIPVGMWLQRRKLARHPETIDEWPIWDFRSASVRRAALAVTAFAALSAAIALVAGYSTLHWMEFGAVLARSPPPMQPQFTACRPGRTRIACANCHIAKGPADSCRQRWSAPPTWHVISNRFHARFPRSPGPVRRARAHLRPLPSADEDPGRSFASLIRRREEHRDPDGAPDARRQVN